MTLSVEATSSRPKAASTVDVIPTGRALGAEIRGVDLRTLYEAAFAQVTAAWHQHSVVLIRGQSLSDQDLIAFSRRLGDLDCAPIQENGRRFVEGLLPVLDSCDAALSHGASEVEPVLTALYGALSKEGLERIDPKGAAFDPAEAEAVVHEPGEGGEQVVSEVLRPGYRWQGKVLRPAMVKVTD